MKETYMMALDAGTTSSRCILFDHKGDICSMAQQEFTQYFPKPGWVEHDPVEIWETQKKVMIQAMDQLKIGADQVAGIGIYQPEGDSGPLGERDWKTGLQCGSMAVQTDSADV